MPCSFGTNAATFAHGSFRAGPRLPFSTPLFQVPVDFLKRYLVIVDLFRPKWRAIVEGARLSPSSYRHCRIYWISSLVNCFPGMVGDGTCDERLQGRKPQLQPNHSMERNGDEELYKLRTIDDK